MTATPNKSKQARWQCPTCGNGILAPTRMRTDDVRRYCLPCSSTSGRLVDRVAPALEKKRQAKAEKRKAATKRKRATAAKKRGTKRVVVQAKTSAERIGYEGFVVEREADRLWRLLEPYHNGKRRPAITTSWGRVKTIVKDGQVEFWNSRSVRGRAHLSSGFIELEPNVTWHTLAHELVHMAVGARYNNGRREAHDEVFYKCLKDLCERRWKIQLSFYKVPPWGYAVDGFIRTQMKGVAKFPKKTKAEVTA